MTTSDGTFTFPGLVVLSAAKNPEGRRGVLRPGPSEFFAALLMTPETCADGCGRGALAPPRRWANDVLRGKGTPPAGGTGRANERSAFVRGLRMTNRVERGAAAQESGRRPGQPE